MGDDEGNLRFTPQSVRELRLSRASVEPAVDLAWTPDGQRVALLSQSGTVVLHDLDWIGEVFSLKSTHATDDQTRPTAVVFDSTGRRLAIVHRDGVLQIWETEIAFARHDPADLLSGRCYIPAAGMTRGRLRCEGVRAADGRASRHVIQRAGLEPDYCIVPHQNGHVSYASGSFAVTNGHADFWQITPKYGGSFSLETTGSTDTIVGLYELSSGNILEFDEDSGAGTNAWLSRAFARCDEFAVKKAIAEIEKRGCVVTPLLRSPRWIATERATLCKWERVGPSPSCFTSRQVPAGSPPAWTACRTVC